MKLILIAILAIVSLHAEDAGPTPERVRELRADAKSKGALVTKELFALVKPSMPKDEAFAILGPGFTVEPFDPRQPNGDKTYNWRNKNGSHVRVVLNRLNQVDRIDVMTPPTGKVELP